MPLIHKAAALIEAKKTEKGIWADVGCILISKSGKEYKGVSVTSGSNTFCAEQIAIGAMVTDGEYKIKKIVAVWKNEEGEIFVIPPCGNCRQLMLETDKANLETEIVLDKDKAVKLKELLPYHDWWKKQ